jgi:hypothetical protein
MLEVEEWPLNTHPEAGLAPLDTDLLSLKGARRIGMER